MLKTSLFFFFFGLVALSFGTRHSAGITFEVGRLVFLTSMIIALGSFLVSLRRQPGKRTF